jgi:hypothetical protein
MNNDSKYLVESFSAYSMDECKGDPNWVKGSSADFDADTLSAAKRRAKYLLSEDYRISSESSAKLVYARVMKGSECVWDCFNPEYEFVEKI